jgi:hypothetical protein
MQPQWIDECQQDRSYSTALGSWHDNVCTVCLNKTSELAALHNIVKKPNRMISQLAEAVFIRGNMNFAIRYLAVVNAKEDTVLKIPLSHPADKGREPCLGRVGEPSTQNAPPPLSCTHSYSPYNPVFFQGTLLSTYHKYAYLTCKRIRSVWFQ